LNWNQISWLMLRTLAGPPFGALRLATAHRFPNNLAAICQALEDAAVEFLPAKNGKGVGVRLREDK
jgi:hypothetical protein